ncbi:MAG: hypothetical protein WD226_06845 [Planctomycetota bacterium]
MLSLTGFLFAMHFGGKTAPQPKRTRGALGWLALGLFGLLFVLRWAEVGDFPVYEPYSTLSCVALGILLLHGLAGREPGVTGIVFGTVAAMQLVASCFGPLEPPRIERVATFDIGNRAILPAGAQHSLTHKDDGFQAARCKTRHTTGSIQTQMATPLPQQPPIQLAKINLKPCGLPHL